MERLLTEPEAVFPFDECGCLVADKNRLEEFDEYDTNIFDLSLSMTSHYITSPEVGEETAEEPSDK